ncbi:MAG: gliding motility-associated C-terminal domain-containing protein [Flavobacteriales bacterium]|jgi:hypothetical protein|nr:gliding motility-associated C-terminal domain-containing protein [Flavobacteriales bacterium]
MKKIIALLSVLFLFFYTAHAQFALPEEKYICEGQNSTQVSMGFNTSELAFLNLVGNATFDSLSLGDDDFSSLINLGFNFKFYGVNYSSVVISSNNFITFNASKANTYSAYTTNNTLGPSSNSDLKNAIHAPFQDINPLNGGKLEYATIGTAPNRAFVVRWLEVPMFNCSNLTFCSAIVLKEGSNVIETHLINKPVCSTWYNGLAIHGVVNSSGSKTTIVYDNDENVSRDHGSVWTASIEGTRFIPNNTNSDYIYTSTKFMPIVSANNIEWKDNLGNIYTGNFSTTVNLNPNTTYITATSDLCSEALSDTTFFIQTSLNQFVDGISTSVGSFCPGDSVALSLALSSDVGLSSVTWSTGSNDSLIYAKTPGLYSVTAQSNDGCSFSKTFSVTERPKPVVSIADTLFLCPGETLSVDISFNNSQTAYSWENGTTNAVRTINSPGNYSFINTLNGCEFRDTFTVAPSVAPSFSLGSDTSICLGNNLILNPDFQTTEGYLWNTGDTTETLSISSPGNYWVQITKQGCSSRDSIAITPKVPPMVNLPDTVYFCTGSSVDLDATSASGASYLWNNSSTDSIINVNQSGTYIVQVNLDACPVFDTAVVIEQAFPITNLGPDQDLCQGMNTTLMVQEGNANYLWNNNQTTQAIQVNTTGIYSVAVTKNGCTSYDTISVDFGNYATVNLPDTVNLCTGDTTILNAFYPNATYLWNTSNTDSAISISQSGTYTVAVNLDGCIKYDTTVVNVHGYPVTNLGPDLSVCQGTAVNLTVQENNATYLWNNNQTTQSINITSSGIYSVAVTKNGCISRDTVQVVIKPYPIVNLPDTVNLCAGDSTVLNATYSNSTYSWNNSSISPTLTVNQAGIYIVEVNLNGCIISDTTVVQVFTPPVTNLGPDITICQGNTVTLTVQDPNATYLWNTNQTTQSIAVTSSGTYSVEADIMGCKTYDTVVVNFTPAPIVNLPDTVHLCSGDSTILNVFNPNATYSWNNSSTDSAIMVNQSGTYIVTVSSNSCDVSDTTVVEVHQYPIINFGPDIEACQGDLVNLTVQDSNISYLWNTNQNTQSISVTTSGNYSVIANRFGCLSYDTINVLFKPNPTLLLPDTVHLCTGDSTILNVFNTNASYSWNTSSTDSAIMVNQSGTYIVQVDLGGCVRSDTSVVLVHNYPIINLGPDQSACQGTPITLSVQENNANYLWNNNQTTQNIQVNTAGTYTVEVTKFGCTSYDTIAVNYLPYPSINLPDSINLCIGNDTILDAYFPGATYLWNNNSTDSAITVNQTGTYIVQANLNGCIVSDTTKVVVHPYPEIDLQKNYNICEGDTIELDVFVHPEATYLWSDNDTSSVKKVWDSQQLSLTINLFGCESTGITATTLREKPKEALFDQGICKGESVFLNASQSIVETYLWSTGDTSSNITITEQGWYWVEMKTAYCSMRDSMYLTVADAPTFYLPTDTMMCLNSQIFLDITLEGATYEWSTGSDLSTQLLTKPGEYTVKVTNACGEKNHRIIVFEQDCACPVYLPNTVVLGENIENAEFRAKTECDLSSFELLIFDRWGGIVFKSNDINKVFNPYDAGITETTTFVYTLRYKTENDKEEFKKGTFVVF